MIFVIADIHAEKKTFEKRISDIEKRFGRKPDERDLLVCAGDLLGNYKRKLRGDGISLGFADKRFLKWLAMQPYQVVSVFGNHDTPTRLYHQVGYACEEMYGNEVLRVSDNVCYLNNGEVYDLEDPCGETRATILALGGAFKHTWRFSPNPSAARRVWREYEHLWTNRCGECGGGDNTFLRRDEKMQRLSEDEYNEREGYVEGYYSDDGSPLLSNIADDDGFHVADGPIVVDYIISHDAPSSKMGWFQRLVFKPNPVNDVMQAIYYVTDFKHWYFGHHHADYEPAKGFTCLYNKTATIGETSAVPTRIIVPLSAS